MRHVPVLIVVWLAGAASASAQVSDRLQLAAVARVDRVSLEGRQHARLPVTGVAVSYRVWHVLRIEGEMTTASGESRRSYEADFISYAGPDATREEIRQRAVMGRRTSVNKAGIGFAAAAAVETRYPGRLNLALRAGVSVRRYEYIEDMTILRVPEGVTVEQAEFALPDARGQRGRSGLLFGVGVPVRIAGNLNVAPEVRWVWGGPARIGNNYDEATAGARISWTF
jgi:hypothetical protein